jgi:hypothetical protein
MKNKGANTFIDDISKQELMITMKIKTAIRVIY